MEYIASKPKLYTFLVRIDNNLISRLNKLTNEIGLSRNMIVNQILKHGITTLEKNKRKESILFDD